MFNASYQVLLQVLIRYFMQWTESEEELTTLSNVAVDTMFQLIRPLGELLTRLPLGQDHPGKMHNRLALASRTRTRLMASKNRETEE